MGRGQSDYNQASTESSRVLGDESDPALHLSPHLANTQLADRLETLNSVANGGRGNSFMLDVIFALRKSDYTRARAIYVHDRDKLELDSTGLRDAADRLFSLELT